MVNKKQLAELLGFRSTTMVDNALKRDSTFPRPFSLNQAPNSPKYWDVDKVNEWLKAKSAQANEVTA
jgi:predicted DNA-binding transcriptional regulator AlpA